MIYWKFNFMAPPSSEVALLYCIVVSILMYLNLILKVYRYSLFYGIISVINLMFVKNNIKIAPCITQRAVPILLISVMGATLDYFYGLIFNFINYTVSIINAPAPVAR